MQENKHPETQKPKAPPWVVWLYLMPVYLAILILLFYWIKKVSQPEVKLSPAEESAFIAPVRMKQISPQEQKKSRETEKKLKEMLEMSPREKMAKRREKREAERKFRIIGSTPGKLIEAVEFAYRNPPAITALFDNKIVVREFLQRETVADLLKDTDKLKAFLISSHKTGEFLDNKTVTKVINNDVVLRAIAKSKLIDRILASPSVEKLINSPSLRQEIIDKNTRLGLLTANFNLLNELKNHPRTKHIAGEYIGE